MKKATNIERILLMLMIFGLFNTLLKEIFQGVSIKPDLLFILMQATVLIVLGRFKIAWAAIPSMMMLAPTISVFFINGKYIFGILIFIAMTICIKTNKKISNKRWFEIAIVQNVIQLGLSPILYWVYYEEIKVSEIYMNYFNMYGGALSLITIVFSYYLFRKKGNSKNEQTKGVFLQKK